MKKALLVMLYGAALAGVPVALPLALGHLAYMGLKKVAGTIPDS